MNKELPLGFNERVIFDLRSLYNSYGYSRYKMNKFEEYDLYAHNKDFLISDSVITFTDTNGKLMALKPDVTLSIVKNSRDDIAAVSKLYYNENVYRASKSTNSFREIMQVGLECIGNIDDYCICEVLMLAAQSLRSISGQSILDISHLGLLSDIIDAANVPQGSKDAVLRCIGEKNVHELAAVCRDCGVGQEGIDLLKNAVTLCGKPADVLPKFQVLLEGIVDCGAVEQLRAVTDALGDTDIADMLRFDFSAVDDIRYYNGIVFKGFVNSLPASVLSGGQYDNLMRKMGRKCGAVGFAVYLDMLERLDNRKKEYDVDTLLVYDASASLADIRAQVKRLADSGISVMVQSCVPENIRCRQILKLSGSEVTVFEYNA